MYRAPREEEFSDIVGLIYASGVEPDKTPEALRGLNAYLEASACRLVRQQSSTGRVLAIHGVDTADQFADTHQQYAAYWCEHDPWRGVLDASPPRDVLSCADQFDEAFVAGCAFYQRHLIPRGLRWSMVGSFNHQPDTRDVVTAFRSHESAPFAAPDKDTLRRALPHFEQASAIRARLHQPLVTSALSASELLQRMPTACVFTDQAGRCIEANDSFRAAMAPLAIKVGLGRLRFADPNLQAQWSRALFETHSTAIGRSFVASGGSGREWMVNLVPARPVASACDAVESRMIIVFFDERAASAQGAQGALALKSRLTRAELEVMGALLQGLPAKAIATRRGASVNTIRSQIMAILDKTGHRSQRELMAAFSTSVLPGFGDSLSGQ